MLLPQQKLKKIYAIASTIQICLVGHGVNYQFPPVGHCYLDCIAVIVLHHYLWYIIVT